MVEGLAVAGEQGVQRRADFVGEVGGELRQALHAVVQPCQHGVERVHRLAQFGRRALGGQASIEAAQIDAAHRFAQLMQRLQSPAQQQQAQRKGEQCAEANRQIQAQAITAEHLFALAEHFAGDHRQGFTVGALGLAGQQRQFGAVAGLPGEHVAALRHLFSR